MHPFSAPWLISEDGLQLCLAIWSRGDLFKERLAQARAAQGDENVKYSRSVQVQDGVMVLPIRGPLFRHAGLFSDISGATSYERIHKDLQLGLSDGAVKQILLLVDSPGGEANGCAELADRIRAAGDHKPITTYIEGAGTSAAYWLSAAAPSGEVVCAPTANLGSIGVVCALLDDSKAQEKMGLREVQIVSSQSPHKRGAPITDEVIARVQTRIDDLADVFISSVARLRGVSEKKVVSDFGGGGSMIGEKAVKAGLADRLGSFDRVFAQLRGPQTRTYTMQTPPAPVAQAQETELVPKTELATAQKRIAELEAQQAASKPLLAQVAQLTQAATPAEQQVALAQIGVRAAQAEQLQGQLGDERAQLLQKARDKKIPPVAMAGWEDLDIPVLRQVVEKTKGIQPHQPATDQQKGADPAGTGEVTLSDEDRSEFRRCGVTDEAQMLEIKKSMKGKK